MLISTAGAPGLRQQRAVNCCLWASETFSSERGALLAPAAVGSGDSASKDGESLGGCATCPAGCSTQGSQRCCQASDGLLAERGVGSRQASGRKRPPVQG